MNEIVNKFLLAGDKFTPELHLRQPRFTYSVCGSFTKHRERIQKFRETSYLKHICQNKRDETCSAHDGAYSDSKDLPKRTISEKILKYRAYEIARIPKYDVYQRGLTSIVCKFFDKKTGSAASGNEELAPEFHKPVIKKFKRREVYARFKDNIWAADLAELG